MSTRHANYLNLCIAWNKHEAMIWVFRIIYEKHDKIILLWKYKKKKFKFNFSQNFVGTCYDIFI